MQAGTVAPETLVRMARFWNGLLRRPASSLERQALDASLELTALRPAGTQPLGAMGGAGLD